MKAIISTVKGTREFYPEEMAKRTWLYRHLDDVARGFGYQEWDAPFIEKLDLYAAKSGEELVKEQAFVFPDRGGDMITLRPELTPSLARMVAARQKELVFPLRWWSFGPFWRYERPQKGRTREFFQWNVDLIGTDSPESDAELIGVAVELFRRLNLTPQQVVLLVNDRRLMDAQLLQLGIPLELRGNVFRLIDKREKLRPEEWANYAIQQGLSLEQFDGIREALQNQELWRESPEMTRLFAMLEAMGAMEYVQFSPEIIRGLDYYTGTVFEAKDRDREGRSILGGGRYNNLVADVGGEPLAGVGFAMGDVMMTLVLEKYGLIPPLAVSPAQVLVTAFDEQRLTLTAALATQLRHAGLRVAAFTEAVKLQRQLKYADRIGARFVVIVGPDEEAAGQATVKDLQQHQQVTVAQAELAGAIQKMLAAG